MAAGSLPQGLRRFGERCWCDARFPVFRSKGDHADSPPFAFRHSNRRVKRGWKPPQYWGGSVFGCFLFAIAEGWKIASESYGQDHFGDRIRPRGVLGYMEISLLKQWVIRLCDYVFVSKCEYVFVVGRSGNEKYITAKTTNK